MNPGLVIKLRPDGPWRVGPDSGARNRVDTVYHSDAVYSAVTSAIGRLGWLDEWLDATARNKTSAVCFSSCFPFLDEIGFVIPPRSIWPPTAPGLMSARVRWKSARFVPLGIVQAMLAGQRLDENHWSVDGASECLVPVGRPGPFRTGMRWSAAVDRLTGAAERHSTACIEFRPGAGLWTIASFADESAASVWRERVKAAFRLLADSGFGGERSRGWGRSSPPEFVEGNLPDMIVPAKTGAETGAEVQGPGTGEAPEAPAEPATEPEASEAEAAVVAPPVIEPLAAELSELPPDPEPEPPAAESAAPQADPDPTGHEPVPPTPEPDQAPTTPPTTTAPPPATNAPEPVPALPEPPTVTPEPLPTEAAEPPVGTQPPTPSPQLPTPDLTAPGPRPPSPSYWMLSLYIPAPDDSVDWRRGNYTVVARSGRVDSSAGAGELKKQIQMVAEGSVVHAASEPHGSAADVAPDGFPHPVFRAGFAVCIPLPEVS